MNDEEIWKDIAGYEGLYQVSNKGNVYSFPRNGTNGGILAKCTMRGEWTTAHLCKDNIKRKIHIHKLVMLAFVGPRPKGMQINHKNGVKTDNRLENLEYCTPSQNIAHAVNMGLINQECDRNNAAKIDSKIAVEIYNSKGTHEFLAAKYGISRSLVSAIQLGKIWAKATGAPPPVPVGPRIGEKNSNSKITAEQAVEIFNSPGKYRDIGDRYGVSPENVFRIKKGKSWKSLNLLQCAS